MRGLRLGVYVCAGLILSVGASALVRWPGQARTGGLVAAAPAGSAPTGLDHAAHAGQVALSGAAAVPCVRCHAMDRRGRVAHRLGHEACFGECHGPRPQRPRPGAQRAMRASGQDDAARRTVCLVCHAADALDRGVFTVPSGSLSGPEHALRLSHAVHAVPSQAHGGCRACHGTGEEQAGVRPGVRSNAGPAGRTTAAPARAATTRPDAHARCTRCHAPVEAGSGSAPAPADGAPAGEEAGPLSMHDCTRCHVAVTAGVLRPHLVPGRYRASFSHARHQARGLDDCRGCHAGVLAAAGSELPAPRTEDCSGCHDGTQAFSVVGPHCRRCHAERSPAQESRPPRGPGYSHRAHQERGLDLPCTRCHQLDARGMPLPPAPEHAPCSDAGCHRDQFMAREPEICGACHVGTEPWARLYFQPRPRPDTEFGARFSHRQHQNADIETCERCHRERSELRDMRLPPQHATCMGAGCHAQGLSQAGPKAENAAKDGAQNNAKDDAEAGAASPEPVSLQTCAGCHVLDLVATRHAQRIAAPWSVRARFEHAPHERDPASGAAVACTTCHTGVVEADSVAAIPGPPKRACRPCHDGRVAFKLTGHGCARCHGQARQP
jgi:c(7)-type cytochrome triheme protein